MKRKEKRHRQNQRLRKILAPKNALMTLHELFGARVSEFNTQGQMNSFQADITLNGKRYIGNGPSKAAAKNDASEKALRDVVIDKLSKFPFKSETNDNEQDDVEMSEEQKEEDNVPMVHLASFALYKLFNVWEGEGYKIPDFKTGTVEKELQTSSDKEGLPKKVRADLPPNAANLHPCMLLSMVIFTFFNCIYFIFVSVFNRWILAF